MQALPRVELQAEVGRRRDQLFELVSTSVGLRRWLDAADVGVDAAAVAEAADAAHVAPVDQVAQVAQVTEPGVAVRFGLADAVATGTVLAVDPPQHVSYSWDWQAEPLVGSSVVAFDLVDHGSRTHLTLRHVGLDSAEQVRIHDAMWRYWFGRLVEVASAE